MKTILFPTDFSPVSDNALPYALELVKRSRAELILYHADFTPMIYATSTSLNPVILSDDELEVSRNKLKTLYDTIMLQNPEINCRYDVEGGSASSNIIHYAEKNQPDCIVMGTEDLGAWERVFAGSVSDKGSEEVKCPVLVIPEKAGFNSPKLFIYATNLSGEEDKIIRQAIAFADLYSAELELLHIRREEKPEIDEVEDTVDELIRKFSNSNLGYRIVREDQIIEGIKEYGNKGDVLVVARHKRNFIEKIFEGDHVRKLVRDAQIPVLILHKE